MDQLGDIIEGAWAHARTQRLNGLDPHALQNINGPWLGSVLVSSFREGFTEEAERVVRAVVSQPLYGGDDSGLMFGVPAVAAALWTVSDDIRVPRRYWDALLDRAGSIATTKAGVLTQRGHRDDGQFSDQDLFRGLAGILRLMVRVRPDAIGLDGAANALGRLLTCAYKDGRPHWWVTHEPNSGEPFPEGGHANLGTAHGLAGIMLCMVDCIDRQVGRRELLIEALEVASSWYRRELQTDDRGDWWPGWLTRRDFEFGIAGDRGPRHASWCYGVPGVAAALARTGDALGRPELTDEAEHWLVRALRDSRQIERLTQLGVCHGWVGLLWTVEQHFPEARVNGVRAGDWVEKRLWRRRSETNERLVDTSFLQGSLGCAYAGSVVQELRKNGLSNESRKVFPLI